MTKNRKEQFAELVLPHLESAYRLARGLAGNTIDAEDIVQDTCIRAFNGLEGFSGTNPRAWLISITRNVAFTFLARNKARGVVLAADDVQVERMLAEHPDPSGTAEAMMIAQADSDMVDRALNALPQPFREIIVLREFNSLSYKEIAEVTGLPIGTVMSRLARARAEMLRAVGSEQAKRVVR